MFVRFHDLYPNYYWNHIISFPSDLKFLDKSVKAQKERKKEKKNKLFAPSFFPPPQKNP